MIARARLAAIAALSCAAALSARGQTPPGGQTPPQSVFRGTTILVPLDVRVVDAKGRPVTDLQAGDFSVREDSVPQTIKHFSLVQMGAGPAVAQGPAGLKPRGYEERGGVEDGAAALTPPTQRVFLLVLGRGRLQPPAKGVDGLIGFVSNQLLPQDRVALSAYNRATNFTISREQLIEVLTRFKQRNDKIELLLQQYESLIGVDRSQLPKNVQALIDEIFAGVRGVRHVNAAADPARTAADIQQTAEAVRRTELSTLDETHPRLTSATDARLAALADRSFEDHVAQSAQTMSDLGRLYAGIEYLRYVEGEKHLVFLYESSLYLPRAEDDYSLAAAANDARVAIDTVQTGGVGGAAPIMRTVSQANAALARPFGQGLNSFMAVQTQRTLSELTGGHASIQTYADKALNVIDSVTRSGYLLGYAPTNLSLDGRYRRIEVVVNRKGLTVMYRHGYYATDDGASAPYRRGSIAEGRMRAAAQSGERSGGVSLLVTAIPGPTIGGSKTVDVAITIGPRGLTFAKINGVHTSTLDLSVFCGDYAERPIGHLSQKLDIKFSDYTYERFQARGLVNTVRVRVAAPARFIKVVVYDYGTDSVGSITTKVQ